MKTRDTAISLICIFLLGNSFQISSQKIDINKAGVYAQLKKVADWQMNTPLKYALADWTNGALFTGMAEWASIANEDTYYEYLKEENYCMKCPEYKNHNLLQNLKNQYYNYYPAKVIHHNYYTTL